jgi:hypothetical protein
MRLLGMERLKDGDNALVAARKVLREKSGRHTAFYDPINYPRGSMV